MADSRINTQQQEDGGRRPKLAKPSRRGRCCNTFPFINSSFGMFLTGSCLFRLSGKFEISNRLPLNNNSALTLKGFTQTHALTNRAAAVGRNSPFYLTVYCPETKQRTFHIYHQWPPKTTHLVSQANSLLLGRSKALQETQFSATYQLNRLYCSLCARSTPSLARMSSHQRSLFFRHPPGI